MALVRDSNALNLIVVRSQKVLTVRIIQVAADNTASCNGYVVDLIRVQIYRVIDFAAKPDSVVELY